MVRVHLTFITSLIETLAENILVLPAPAPLSEAQLTGLDWLCQPTIAGVAKPRLVSRIRLFERLHATLWAFRKII